MVDWTSLKKYQRDLRCFTIKHSSSTFDLLAQNNSLLIVSLFLLSLPSLLMLLIHIACLWNIADVPGNRLSITLGDLKTHAISLFQYFPTTWNSLLRSLNHFVVSSFWSCHVLAIIRAPLWLICRCWNGCMPCHTLPCLAQGNIN